MSLAATQRFDQVLPGPGDTFRIDLRPDITLDALRALAEALLPSDSMADRRRRSADWLVFIHDRLDADAAQKLGRQWDSLRIDGYWDSQVVASFTASIVLLALQLGLIAGHPRHAGTSWRGDGLAPLTSLFGGDLFVEFTGLVGYGHAVVSAQDLQAAVREDIGPYLPADLYDGCGPSTADRMHRLLIGVHKPNLLFDFSRFSEVYVRQVIPMAAIFRPDLPLFPVLRLQTFGVP